MLIPTGNVVPMKPAVTATLAVNAKMEAEKQLKATFDTKRDVKTEKKVLRLRNEL